MALFFSLNAYIEIKTDQDGDNIVLQNQTEHNFAQAVMNAYKIWEIFEESQSRLMKKSLDQLQQDYVTSGANPQNINLERIKTQIGSEYNIDNDLYIINESGVIEYATDKGELGWDFSRDPGLRGFYQRLQDMRQSSGFFAGRLDRDRNDPNVYMMYAYMPTPDHKYILEIGFSYSPDEISTHLSDQKHLESIVYSNPFIVDYAFYTAEGRRIDDNSLAPPSDLALIREVVKTKTPREVVEPGTHNKTRYFLVDLESKKYITDFSRVVSLTYSTQLQQDALNRLILRDLIIGLSAIIIGCILAIFLVRWQSRPVKRIVEDIDVIARGALDHRIRPNAFREFSELEQNINRMVDSIRSGIKQIRDNEAFLQEMIAQLPVGVFIKSAENGQYVYWNKTCERMFDMTSERVIGCTDYDLFPEMAARNFSEEDGEVKAGNIIVRNKIQKGRVTHMLIAPMTDSEGKVGFLLGIAEDVTSDNLNIRMDLLFSITRHDILENLSKIMTSFERAQLLNTPDDMKNFFDQTLGSVKAIKNQISFMRALQDLGIISPKW